MSAFETKMAKVATDLITKFGAAVNVTRGGVSQGTGVGVFVTTKTIIEAAQEYQTAITTKSMFISAGVKSVMVGDIVTFQSQNYTVKTVEVYSPVSKAIAFKVEVTYG